MLDFISVTGKYDVSQVFFEVGYETLIKLVLLREQEGECTRSE